MKKYVNLDIYTREDHSVQGWGYQCVQIVKHWKFIETISFNRFETELDENAQLTEHDCLKMVKYKKCGRNEMTCDEDGCSFDGSVNPSYSWMNSIVKITDHCFFKRKEIIADNEDSFIFSHNCKVKDYQCAVADSMIVWNSSVIHPCPYKRIMKNETFEIDEKGFRNNEVYFIYDGLLNTCNNKLMKTVEGVFLRLTNSLGDDSFYTNTKISENISNVDLKLITELMLGTVDLERIEADKKIQEVFNKSCSNFQNYLKIFRTMDGIYDIQKDYNNKAWILYATNNEIYTSDCLPVRYITFLKQQSNDRYCKKALPIKYLLGKNAETGYLHNNQIIEPKEPNKNSIPCSQDVRFFETGYNHVITLEGSTTSLQKRSELKNFQQFRFYNGYNEEVSHKQLLKEDFVLKIAYDDTENKVSINSELVLHLQNKLGSIIDWSHQQSKYSIILWLLVILLIIGGVCGVMIRMGLNPCLVLARCCACCCRATACCCRCTGRCCCFYIRGCCMCKKEILAETALYNAEEGVVKITAPSQDKRFTEEFHKFLNS